MEVLWFRDGAAPEVVEPTGLPERGFLWFDFIRDEASGWAERVARLTGVSVHENHVADSLNASHPSFSDGSSDYDMLIFHGLASDAGEGELQTRPLAYFVFSRVLVTVRSPASISIPLVRRRLAEGTLRAPQSPSHLLLRLVSAMVDRFLALREPLLQRIESWQRRVLDPEGSFDDWRLLLDEKTRLRRLAIVCEEQRESLTAWREDTDLAWDDSLTIRFNDIREHIDRVLTQAEHLRSDLESLIQINFAAAAHRANEVMKVLTVVAAIFLPLGLVAGIFGMNFEYMPGMATPGAYFATIAFMVGTGVGLFTWFRRKRWI